MAGCPSHLLLSRFKSDDLTEDEAKRIRAHLAVCEKCRALSLSMDANIQTFLEHGDARFSSLSANIEALGPAPLRKTGFKVAAAGSLIAVAAAALLVFIVGLPFLRDSSGENGIAFKGGMSVEIVAARGDRRFAVKDGAALFKGDAVRFVVTVDRPGYLAIFSEDRQGRITPFYPSTEPVDDSRPMALSEAGRHTLPGSIVLDDAIGKERFVVVFSEQVFDRADVLKRGVGAEKNLKKFTLKKGFSIQSVTVKKENKTGL